MLPRQQGRELKRLVPDGPELVARRLQEMQTGRVA